MDKLLQIISKLRNAIVPENPLSKMSKEDILAFIEESNLLERMRTFHQRAEKGIRSAITDDEEDTLIPNAGDLKKMRIGKLRKMVRQFHKATQILRKYEKYSASRLRSHVKRHRYEEMLYGEDMPETEKKIEKNGLRFDPQWIKTKGLFCATSISFLVGRCRLFSKNTNIAM